MKLVVLAGQQGSIPLFERIVPRMRLGEADIVVCLLHMPPFFNRQLVSNLSRYCRVPVEFVRDGQTLAGGRVYVLPGTDDFIIERDPDRGLPVLRAMPLAEVPDVVPSADVFMRSAAVAFTDGCIGVLVGEMYADGIEGLKAIRRNGGRAYRYGARLKSRRSRSGERPVEELIALILR